MEQGAAIPDHRERKVEVPDVARSTEGGEVQVIVNDSKVTALRLDSEWLRGADPVGAATLIQETVNAALEEWFDTQLRTIQEGLPDMKELHASISVARQKLQDAWVATLAEAKTP